MHHKSRIALCDSSSDRSPLRACFVAALAAATLLPAQHALALLDDKLELFVKETITYDSNVFRISDSEDPLTAIGSPSKSDTYYTTALGFNLNIPISRQRVIGGWTWDFERYNDYEILDFDGHEGRLIWQWQLGDDLSGELGYRESEALASLANTRAGFLTGTPNALDTWEIFLNATYLLSARWRLGWDVSRLEQTNSFPPSQVNDVIIDGAGVTVNYVTPSENLLGLNLDVEEGEFPNRELVAGTLIDNSYRQLSPAAVADLTLSGASRVRARAGWVTRNYDNLPERDIDTGVYNVTYDWTPAGKFSLRTLVERAINPLDDQYSIAVLEERISLIPRVRFTEKFRMDAVIDFSEREYLGDRRVALGTTVGRVDDVRNVGIGAYYQPIRQLLLEATVRREERTSNALLGDYTVNIFSAGARLSF